jgi:endoglucanase
MVGALLVSLLLAGAGPGSPSADAGSLVERLKRAVHGLTAGWVRGRRQSQRSEPDPFDHLAASQVGYGPSMPKHFTSPRPFASFRVVSEHDGTVVLLGGPPARSVRTTALGPIDAVWIGDFSALVAPGRYRILADNGLRSHPFEVSPTVFDPAVRAVQRWFYYQRAFTAVAMPYAEGPWVHDSDVAKAPAGVAGGWHDAGDFSIYSASLNVALFWMLEAWSDFAPPGDDTHIPESGNGVPDLLDEARWGISWLLSVQDAQGGFANTTCAGGYRGYGKNTHRSMPGYSVGEVGPIATARAVGTLAYASTVFRAHDGAFADRCLAAARTGYAYLSTRQGDDADGPSCPAYRADGNHEVGRHVRMYAAAGMLLATGEARFRDDFERNYEELRYTPDYHHVNGFAARIYLRAPEGEPARKRALRKRLGGLADLARADGEGNPFGLAPQYQWGSISASLHRTGSFSAPGCLEEPARPGDCEQALASVHHALGRNYLQFCYVSGLSGVTRGMRHAFHHWLAALQAEPFLFPGMVAGGPNPAPDLNDVSYPRLFSTSLWGYWDDPAFPRDPSVPIDGRYTDNDSWSTNEVAVNWQGAALYNLYLAQWVAQGRPRR